MTTQKDLNKQIDSINERRKIVTHQFKKERNKSKSKKDWDKIVFLRDKKEEYELNQVMKENELYFLKRKQDKKQVKRLK